MMTIRFFLSLLLGVGLAAEAWARPIYVTVPRAYSSQEDIAIDVAFSGREAVELRVAKPDDLGKFLTAQANLRRAYSEPVVTLNPGRFLSRGLNAIRNPGTFLFNGLSTSFRQALSANVPERPEPSGKLQDWREGAEKLVSVPREMSVVRSEWLNLDLGGDESTFNVPGFETWGQSGGFQERRVMLKPLPPGVYVVQLVQGMVEGQVTLVVSDMTVQLKQTDGKALVRVAGRDQKPVAGAQVQVWLPGTAGPSEKTDDRGEAWLDVAVPKLLVTVTRGQDIAVVDSDFYSTLAVAPDVFIYGDRPIYKPGDELQFRGVVRKPASFLSQLFTPKNRQVRVKLFSGGLAQSKAAEVLVGVRIPLDEFGSFHGTLKVPDDAEAGVVRLDAELDEKRHQAEARVQQYVKPTFYVEIESEQDSIKPGESLKAKIKARRYSGGVPTNTAYEVFLYRTLLDTPAWVDDAGKGAVGSAVTYGSASTTEGQLSLPKRLYSSLAQRMEGASPDDDPWLTAAHFDDKGEGAIEIAVPALEPGEERLPFKYTLSVRAKDDQNSEATAGKSFYLSDAEVMAALSVSRKLAKKTDAVELLVRSTSLAGKAYPQAEGQVSFSLVDARGDKSVLGEKTFQTDAQGTARVPFPDGKIGTVVASVTLKDRKGGTAKNEAQMVRIGEAGEAVMATPTLLAESASGVLEPGGKAELIAMFPDKWGPQGKNTGRVWVTLSGTSLFSTALLDVTGQTLTYEFPIEKQYGSAVHASLAYPMPSGAWDERTVAFRIVPKQRVLTVRLQPERAEAQPLSEQSVSLRVTDHEGNGVSAQVSLSVVDKAIYALQSELRPNVIDFFYPLVRNNVESFYSQEFQGYGYGEYLARARMTRSPFQFAAVKPPSQKTSNRDRDTAYWNPAIVTDSEGVASVSFPLPANQTTWIMTAVAADASGRFGEGLSDFATRGALTVAMSAPQFLRAGDEVEGNVRLALGEAAKQAAKVDVAFSAAAATLSAQASSLAGLALNRGDETIVPFSLKADNDGVSTVGLSVKPQAPGEVLKDDKRIPVRKSAIEETLRVSAWGGGDLQLPTSGERLLGRAELVLMPSSVDAALSSLSELLTYPYGCLEQLLATTIPNVAIYHTLQKAGAKLDSESHGLLELARSRAVQGVDRILARAVKGGGFTWFDGYATPSAALTIIALDGLAYAIEAGVVAKDTPEITQSLAWLGSQADLPFELDATRTYVLSRYEGAKAAPRVRQLVDKSEQTNNLYAYAMAALASERSGIANEAGFKDKLALLTAKAKAALNAQTNLGATPDAFWLYPLRQVGFAAVLSHATSQSETDLAASRKRFVQAMASDELSTFDRATVLLHNLWLVEHDAKSLQKMTAPSLEAAGKKVSFAPRGFGMVATLEPGVTSVKVGGFDGVASLRATASIPLASVQPLQDGMTIERDYYLLRDSSRKKLQPGDALTVNDEVYVELRINARAGDKYRSLRSAYYVVRDATPAGFVALSEDKAFRTAPHDLPLAHEALKQRTFTPEAATFFFEEPAFWSDSPRVTGYVMRAQFAGKFQAPPATVTDMYAANVRGRTKATTLSVKGR